MNGLYDMTEGQQSLVELMRDLMVKEVKPHILEWEKEGHYSKEITQVGIDMGLHVVQVPREHGGIRLDITTTAMMIEEGIKIESTYTRMFNVTGMGDKIVMATGNEEQKQYYVGLLNKGSISAFCLTGPGVGPDSTTVRTTAVRRGGSYVINETKMFITNAFPVDIFLVVASVDPPKGSRGLAMFTAERDREGVNVSKKIDKFGTCLSDTTEVVFEGVEIPACDSVGTEESGSTNAAKVSATSRPTIAASSLGTHQLARDLAVQHFRERVAFGKSIYAEQMIQEKLADMEMLIQASRGLAYHATTPLDQGKPYNMGASVAKCFVTEASGRIIDQAPQIFGGYGLRDEYPISELYRDARMNRIVEGTNEVQRVMISKAMLR